MRFFLTAILFTAFFMGLSCEKKPSEKYAFFNNDEITQLKENDLERFLNVFPSFMEYSRRYRATLSSEAQNEPDFNEKFFSTLEKIGRFQSTVSNSFKDFNEYLVVFKSVLLGYSVMESTTNFDERIPGLLIMQQSNRIYLTQLQELARRKDLQDQERRQIMSQAEKIEQDGILLSNLVLIRPYKERIDAINQADMNE